MPRNSVTDLLNELSLQQCKHAALVNSGLSPEDILQRKEESMAAVHVRWHSWADLRWLRACGLRLCSL